ncbi:MAG: hypothetical protein U0U66_07810 [Cytophagaceae bacterium]
MLNSLLKLLLTGSVILYISTTNVCAWDDGHTNGNGKGNGNGHESHGNGNGYVHYKEEDCIDFWDDHKNDKGQGHYQHGNGHGYGHHNDCDDPGVPIDDFVPLLILSGGIIGLLKLKNKVVS